MQPRIDAALVFDATRMERTLGGASVTTYASTANKQKHGTLFWGHCRVQNEGPTPTNRTQFCIDIIPNMSKKTFQKCVLMFYNTHMPFHQRKNLSFLMSNTSNMMPCCPICCCVPIYHHSLKYVAVLWQCLGVFLVWF